MRFILTLLIWVVIVGGLYSYSKQRSEAEANIVRQVPVIQQVEQSYSLRLTPTFSAEEDPFALQIGEDTSSLEVRLNGRNINIAADSLQRGTVHVIDNISGLVLGDNEIYVQASPPLSESGLSNGVRVELLAASAVVVDNTLWAEAGAQVAGTVHFHLKEQQDEHDH